MKIHEEYLEDIKLVNKQRENAIKKVFDKINEFDGIKKEEMIREIYFISDIPWIYFKKYLNTKKSAEKYFKQGIEVKSICKRCNKETKVMIKTRTKYKEYLTGGFFKTIHGKINSKDYCKECYEELKTIMKEKSRQESIKEFENNKKKLNELKTMAYNQYLKTEHWKNFRKKIIKYADNKCQMCNSKGILHVHHRNYECRGEESYKDVVVLCANCHAKFHDKI